MPIARQLALISESKIVSVSDLLKVSAALQKQASRDLAPVWEISATVDVFERLEDVPTGYWPLIVMDDIQVPGAAGVHEDRNGQPIGLVSSSRSIDEWSLTASHEAVEMLVDPFGNRLIAGDSPKGDQGRVSFLVEVADPCESPEFAYRANGILVSDFYTPNYFDPIVAPSVRYSYTGAVTWPREVLLGGYLSWLDPNSSDWWQEVWFGGVESTFRNLGPINVGAEGNLRAAIDRKTNAETAAAMSMALKRPFTPTRLTAALVETSAGATAHMWREQINRIIHHRPGAPNVETEHSRRAPRRVRASKPEVIDA